MNDEIYYHASQISGLSILNPHISNHGIPLVYFSKKREKQPPPNSDAPHPAPDIVIKPPTKKIPMPRNIPTP